MTRVLRLLAAALLVVVALAGCSSSGSPALMQVGGDNHGKAGNAEIEPNVPLNEPYIIADVSAVCVADKPVTITGGSTIGSSGAMKVLGWESGQPPDGLSPGDGPGTFPPVRPGYSLSRVTAKCTSNEDSAARLDLEVEITKPVATSQGFHLDYTQDGNTRQAFLSLAVTLCSAKKCPGES